METNNDAPAGEPECPECGGALDVEEDYQEIEDDLSGRVRTVPVMVWKCQDCGKEGIN